MIAVLSSSLLVLIAKYKDVCGFCANDAQCPLCVIGKIGAIAAFKLLKETTREKYNI